jgi:hypothetical protein
MKIGPVGAELFHVDGGTDVQTDRYDEAYNRYSYLCEGASKTEKKLLIFIIIQCRQYEARACKCI